MPELPEVERVRQVLETHLPGLVVDSVHVQRADVVHHLKDGHSRRHALLCNGRFARMHRHGKRLALEVEDGRVLEVGLGMTGQFLYETNGHPAQGVSHRHVFWRLRRSNGKPAGRLSWRDPRRFGGLTPMKSLKELHLEYWQRLGPDALEITSCELRERLKKTKRAVKTALLDQKLLAGLGNIYADEALFRARIAPRTPGQRLSNDQIDRLHQVIKPLLSEATRAGGSTIQDYADPFHSSGSFQASHAVYGRLDQPCGQCGTCILSATLGGRTTHWCPRCQKP